MSTEIRVPALPESVSDATVLTWHKKPGEAVSRDDNLVDLETDKVVLEVPSPIDGILSKTLVEEGALVKADDVLATIDTSALKTTAEATAAPSEKPEPAEPAESKDEQSPLLTPAVRGLVKEMNVDTSQIHGSGKDGRIVKADVMRYLDERDQKQPERDPDTPIGQELVNDDSENTSERPEQRVPMSRLRARIAERLIEAQQNAAILTTFNEVDLTAVNELRKRYKESFEKQHGVKLGYMSFFVRASIEALKRFPVLNASIDEQDIIYHGYFDIGIAVGSPRGLVVPILRDADQSSFGEIEQRIKELGKKAQDGSLTYDELTGGTFTISNGGVYGSMLSTPILNPPQSGILGMHNIQQRPVVVNGEIVVRPMMYLALSYDHRIVDGREAVQFLVTIKQVLEDPARLLLQL